MLQRIKDSNLAVLSCSAWNKQMIVTAHSDWGSASDVIRRQLNKKCKEQEICSFSPVDLLWAPSSCKAIPEGVEVLWRFCTFISDWDSPTLEQSVIQGFGLHDAVKHAEATMLQRIKDSNSEVLSCSAWNKTAHSDWGNASDVIRRQLNKKCKEQEICSFTPVDLLWAPSSCKAIPEGVEGPDDLLHHGWRLISVGEIARPMVHMFPHGIRDWRLQYDFHHRIVATVHVIMGSNFNRLIMLLSRTDSPYHLWEKEQAVVFLFRMFTVTDLIFVQDRVDMINTLASLIQMRSQYTKYILHLSQTLCGTLVGGSSLGAPVIQNELILFWPLDIQLPQEGSGYCYIIVLLQDMGTMYIGQALSLVNELNQLNQGIGSLQTWDPRLHLWLLISFVCGFDGNCDMMCRFETNWQRRQQNMLQTGTITMPEQIADIAQMIITKWNQDGLESNLCYMRPGTFSFG